MIYDKGFRINLFLTWLDSQFPYNSSGVIFWYDQPILLDNINNEYNGVFILKLFYQEVTSLTVYKHTKVQSDTFRRSCDFYSPDFLC